MMDIDLNRIDWQAVSIGLGLLGAVTGITALVWRWVDGRNEWRKELRRSVSFHSARALKSLQVAVREADTAEARQRGEIIAMSVFAYSDGPSRKSPEGMPSGQIYLPEFTARIESDASEQLEQMDHKERMLRVDRVVPKCADNIVADWLNEIGYVIRVPDFMDSLGLHIGRGKAKSNDSGRPHD